MSVKRIFEKPWLYDVVVDERTGAYFLDVVCGGVGMYVVRIRLTPEEIEDFKRNETSLDGLARQVSYDPDRFAERLVTTDESR